MERRCRLSNRFRKYKIIKDIYELKLISLINEYYISMRSLWKGLDFMILLSEIGEMIINLRKVIKSIESYKEEIRLFEFLNRFSDVYNVQRS